MIKCMQCGSLVDPSLSRCTNCYPLKQVMVLIPDINQTSLATESSLEYYKMQTMLRREKKEAARVGCTLAGMIYVSLMVLTSSNFENQILKTLLFVITAALIITFVVKMIEILSVISKEPSGDIVCGGCFKQLSRTEGKGQSCPYCATKWSGVDVVYR